MIIITLKHLVSGLTATQRAANLYQDETTPLRRSPQQLRSNYTLHSNDPVDQLILQMEENLASGRFAAGEGMHDVQCQRERECP